MQGQLLVPISFLYITVPCVIRFKHYMSMVWTLYEHYMNSKLNLGASEQHFLTWTNVWKHKNAYLLVFLYAVVHINICACCVRNPIILVTPPCGVFSYILIWASAWNVICDACMHTDNLLSFRLLCTDASPFFLLNSSLSFSLLSFYSASFLIFLCCLHTSFSPQSLFSSSLSLLSPQELQILSC